MSTSKVTDPDGVLTPAEHTYLTEELNKRQPLKDALVTNAKSIMTLLDHYPEKFGAEHTLNLESFSKVIDYGQVFSRNTIGNFMDTIIYQIESNAPKREVVEDARVDVHAWFEKGFTTKRRFGNALRGYQAKLLP